MRVRVVGKGPVALSFGLLLRRQGIGAAQIELELARESLPPALALRTLALSAGSWQVLSRIAALPPAAAITAIDISLQGRAGRTRLDAAEHRLGALGHVVRYPALCDALLDAADSEGFAAPGSLAAANDLLVVHAEGDTGVDAEQRAFTQSAIVTEVSVRTAAPGIAYERFTGDGPLALLPLPEPDRHALVWCCQPEQAQRRVAASSGAFIDELNEQLGPRQHVWRIDTPRLAMPLVRRLRRQSATSREIWIGNSAQSLHPVAGQGFNLGLRDAFVLAREIGRRDLAAIDARGDPGRNQREHAKHSDYAGLSERYARARHADRSRVVGLTDLLARVFTVRPLHAIESVALAALDLHAGSRGWLARQMMFGTR